MSRILVVEDDQILRQNIVTLLNAENYKSLEAENGNNAILILKLLKPDLVISDIDMKELDGFELLKFMRSSPQFNQIPVIFLTGSRDEAKKRRDINADICLSKPFNSTELLASLEVLLKKI